MGWKAAKLVQPAAKPVATWMANQLLFKPLWRIQQGFANPIGTASSLHTAATWSDRVRLGMAVAGLVEGSSSESYQQNGGPSAPLHQQGQPVPVVVPAASPSAHGGGRSGAKPRCPYRFNRFRHYWARGLRSGARCVKSAGHSGPHRKG